MDIRRELDHIERRGYGLYQRMLGEGVIWHEFDGVNSNYHQTYDEGGRRYRPGILVPTLWVIILEAERFQSAEGRKSVPRLRMAVPIKTLRQCGVSNPTDFNRHLNDVLVYEKQYWDIDEFSPKGRLKDDVIVGISALKSYPDEERIFDRGPSTLSSEEATRPMGYPNNSVQFFPNHPLPARNGEEPYWPLYGGHG